MHHVSGDAGLLHGLMLVVWVPALLAWRALDRTDRTSGTRLDRTALGGVVALTYLAGLMHLVALPGHARESALYGAFFALAATGQLVLAVVLARRPTLRVLEAGVLAQLALVLVWAMTRTVGPPLGPAAWHPEAVGFLDLSCALSEAAAVGGSLWLMARHAPVRRRALRPA